GGADGGPVAGEDRGAGVEGVVAELAIDAFRSDPAHSGCPPGPGERIVIAMLPPPLVEGGAEELHEIRGVHALERLPPEASRWLDRAEPNRGHAGAHDLGPLRHLEARYQLAVDELGFAVMQTMVFAEDRYHPRTSRTMT